MSSLTLERAAAAAALAFFSAFSIASADVPAIPIAGTAVAIDGDTLQIDDLRIRLEGIDAPEMVQTCVSDEGASWSCGRDARKALAAMVKGQTVLCDKKGQDKYGRTLAVCYVEGDDINAALIKRGLAWAFVKYSTVYSADETSAKAARLGIWQAHNTPAWDFRKNRWAAAEGDAPKGCAIKGNISGNGQIYHVPWSAWYDKVKIDKARGEQWFCTEGEAQAAGFRPAIQP